MPTEPVAPPPADAPGTPAPPPPADASGVPVDDPAGASPDAEVERPAGTRFVFLDTEATGLDHTRHELTEVAWIVRFEDGHEETRRYFPEHSTDGADDDALELTHYEERIAPQPKTPARVWLTEFLEHARDAVLVGAVPDFDEKHLALRCRKLGLEPTWDHHLLDVETLALPLIAPGPEAPRSLAKTCEALGLPHDRDQAHGALYDAQQARAVFDRVWELTAQLRASGDPLPAPVPREPRRGGGPASTPTTPPPTPAAAAVTAVDPASRDDPAPPADRGAQLDGAPQLDRDSGNDAATG